MPSTQSDVGLTNRCRTIARATGPVTCRSTSVSSSGAATAAPSPPRKSSVPSVTRGAAVCATAPVAARAATGVRQSIAANIASIGRIGLMSSPPGIASASGLANVFGLGRQRRNDDSGGHGRPDKTEPANLEVHAAVELLALLTRVVAKRSLGAERGDLHRHLRHAELDQELLDRLGTALGEDLVVGRRPLDVGIAGDEHGPRVGARHAGRRVLKQPGGIRKEARALEVEV